LSIFTVMLAGSSTPPRPGAHDLARHTVERLQALARARGVNDMDDSGRLDPLALLIDKRAE